MMSVHVGVGMNYEDEGYGDCEVGEEEWLEEQAVLADMARDEKEVV